MQGLHLTADLYQCGADGVLLTDVLVLAAACRTRTLRAGLTVVGETWHRFAGRQGQPGGVTGVLLLAESHVAVHTWPERGGVTLDVYVCNVEADNSATAEALMHSLIEAFAPQQVQLQSLRRGEMGPSAAGP